MAIGSYSDLSSAIDDYADRTYGQSLKDIWISNAEAKFNRRLGPTYRRAATTTLTTNSSGEATLPSGFVTMRSVVRDVAGSPPLKQVGWNALKALNAYGLTGEPVNYAISGTTFKVSPIAEDDFTALYDSTLTPLTSSNASNWLLAIAPDAYLTMCLAEEAAYRREWTAASGLEATALGMIDAQLAMDQVAQFGNVETVLDGATP